MEECVVFINVFKVIHWFLYLTISDLKHLSIGCFLLGSAGGGATPGCVSIILLTGGGGWCDKDIKKVLLDSVFIGA